jgi:hypothetical protein
MVIQTNGKKDSYDKMINTYQTQSLEYSHSRDYLNIIFTHTVPRETDFSKK